MTTNDMDKALLLIIDAQYDFCNPAGSLYVNGAEDDMLRLAAFIKGNGNEIGGITLSQDSHQIMDISHPAFWRNAEGAHPEPYTAITADDVKNGVWQPVADRQRTLEYLTALDTQGEFPHVVWPEHCVSGSKGAAIVDVVMNEVANWSRTTQKCFTVVQKGGNPMTEHFGILKASIPIDDAPETQENKALLSLFARYPKIYIAGEAQSHCVANTVKQLLPYPEIAARLTLLTDCMSPVTGFEHIADAIYSQLKSDQFITTC
jgi:nicotinamidase-related amidase